MEFSEILSSIASIVTPIATCIIAFLITRRGSKSDKNSSILEEQYLKVVSPIHRTLNQENKEDAVRKIGKIIANEYYLLPNNLYDDYINYQKGDISNEDFAKIIDGYNGYLRSKLGYSKIKMTKQEKKAAKQLANGSNKYEKILNVFLMIIISAFLIVGIESILESALNSSEFIDLSNVSIGFLMFIAFSLMLIFKK